MKRKANISIELQASNVTNGMDLPDSDWGDFSCRRAVDSSSYFRILTVTRYEIRLSQGNINGRYVVHKIPWKYLDLHLRGFIHNLKINARVKKSFANVDSTHLYTLTARFCAQILNILKHCLVASQTVNLHSV